MKKQKLLSIFSIVCLSGPILLNHMSLVHAEGTISSTTEEKAASDENQPQPSNKGAEEVAKEGKLESPSAVNETAEAETSTSSTENETKEEINDSTSATKQEAERSSDSTATVSSEEKTEKAAASRATTLADWNIPVTVSGQEAHITGYVGSDADRVIPTLEELKAADPATYGSCTQLAIGIDGLKAAANNATSLSMSTNGSKVKVIGTSLNSTFYNNRTIKSINLNNLDTSNVTDMSRMFDSCSKLTSLDVSKFDTSNVTDMILMFSQCSGLTSLDVSNFNTSNVTDMDYMFVGCSGLTSLDVSKFDTSNVTNMSNMFDSCSNLTSLDVSKFDTSNVTNMSNMFVGCSGLTSLDVSKFDTSNVTNMSNMFSQCSGLTSLDLSNFNTSNVTDMTWMFSQCSGLTSLDVSNFNTSNVTDMIWMFSQCSGLTSLDVSNFNTSNVTDMDHMFVGCSGLTSLDVSKFDTSNVTDMTWMFGVCSGLTSLDVSNFNTSNVTSMFGMFGQCSGLTSLDVSNFNTSNVTDMGSMFSRCSGLTSLDLSNFNTANVTNMNSMFYTFSSTPLLLKIDKFNNELLNYNYSSDNRVPAGPTLNPDGGSFLDGTTQTKSYLDKVALTTEEYTEKEKLDNFKTFIQDNTPQKSTFRFVGWQDKQGNTPDQVTNPLDQLTTIYMAQWQAIPNPTPPAGSERPNGTQTSGLGIAYYPIQMSTDQTNLTDSGQQEIPFKETTGFHAGVRDVNSNVSWELTAQLTWQGKGLEGSYIQVANSNGEVTSNKNDGVSAPSPGDLEPTTEIVGSHSPKITDTPIKIMEAPTTNNRVGVYDYALGDAKLIIPETRAVQPSNYTGTVNWNLVKAP
ncbi:BspA family leucine-rich repeat surface protein [Enterococcus faecalis]|uniref:BspA family leucine-rich repeat surface protein n=1 Tax=Enterococcus faecalis TaxID=1351 RepID=UPI0025B183A4|nr:BspA family leucine-rich repeat surface protein [Enterococcus faecalis]MDN3202153.1 BspA family leucine-rich repeat surface protein [Enterococcus faecalis]